MDVKRSALILLLIMAVFLGGCAQAFFPGGGGGSTGFILTVSPANIALLGLNTEQFAAKTNDGSRPTLTWAVNGVAGGNATLGTVSATGLYTAPEFPPAPNTITVSATDTVNSNKTASSAVTLDNPIPQLSTVSPMTIPVGPFPLTLTGLHFAPGATAYMGTMALTTTVNSSTQLTATGT